MMKKFCLFCGKKPGKSKSLEHIIPQWLIEYTGNPSRNSSFGLDYSKFKDNSDLTDISIDDVKIEFSFNSFKFPACEDCNNTYSKLEGCAKKAILRLLEEKPLSEIEFQIILDWFDKVRIGLWLGFIMLNKNIWGITPSFYINSRLGNADRLLFIYRIKGISKGINFIGVNSPGFQHQPSVIGLRINQFLFINASSPFLFSNNLGLPHIKPEDKLFSSERKISVYPLSKLIINNNKPSYPLIDVDYKNNCTEIYQPIISNSLFADKDALETFNQNKNIESFFDIKNSNKGNVLFSKKDELEKYGKERAEKWIPDSTHKQGIKSILDIFKKSQNIEIKLIKNGLKGQDIEDNFKQHQKKVIEAHRKFMRLLKR